MMHNNFALKIFIPKSYNVAFIIAFLG